VQKWPQATCCLTSLHAATMMPMTWESCLESMTCEGKYGIETHVLQQCSQARALTVYQGWPFCACLPSISLHSRKVAQLTAAAAGAGGHCWGAAWHCCWIDLQGSMHMSFQKPSQPQSACFSKGTNQCTTHSYSRLESQVRK